MKKSHLENCSGLIGTLIFLTNSIDSICNIEDSFFYNNSGSESPLFFLHNSIIFMNRCEFNYSTDLIIVFYSTIVANDLKIENLKCSSSIKGCVLTLYLKSEANISNCFVNEIISNRKGGIIYIYFSLILVKNSVFNKLNIEDEGAFLYSDSSLGRIINSTFKTFISGLFFIQKTLIELSDVTIDNKLSGAILKASVIYTLFYNSIFIKNSIFMKIVSLFNGSCLYFNGLNVFYNITNSSFINNTSYEAGGVISHHLSQGFIENCIFVGNSAKIGGVINIMTDPNLSFPTILLRNIFINNGAETEGGALKWFGNLPHNLSSNIYENNFAKVYGNNVANRPVRFNLKISNLSNLSFIELNKKFNKSDFENGLALFNQKSGDVISNKLEVFLLDYEQKIYKTKNRLIMKVDLINHFSEFKNNKWLHDLQEKYQYNNSQIKHIFGALTTVINENYSFIFNQIKIVSDPNSLVFLKISSSSTDFLPSNLLGNYLLIKKFIDHSFKIIRKLDK